MSKARWTSRLHAAAALGPPINDWQGEYTLMMCNTASPNWTAACEILGLAQSARSLTGKARAAQPLTAVATNSSPQGAATKVTPAGRMAAAAAATAAAPPRTSWAARAPGPESAYASMGQ